MIVGLILDFVFIVLIALFTIYVILEKKKVDKEKYEFKTGMNKGYLVFSIIFIALGLILLGGSIALYFTNVPEGCWVCFGMGVVFALLAEIVLYDNLLDFEAIDNNEVVIKRVSKRRRVDIKEIKILSISLIQNSALFAFDKNNKKLFAMALQTGNIGEFVELLSKKSIELNSDMTINFLGSQSFTSEGYLQYIGKLDEVNVKKEIVTTEKLEKRKNEKEVFIQVGEEYKKNIPIKLKKEKTKFIITFFASTICFLLGSYFLRNTFFLIIVPFVLSGEIKAYLNIKKRTIEEEKQDPEELGRKHYYSNERVVGHSQMKRKNAKVLSIFFLVFGLVITIPTFFCFFATPIPKEEMIEVEGTISYIKLDEDDGDYIAIGIKEEQSIEYRIYSKYHSEINETIFEKDGSGEKIVLFVENEEPIKNKSEFDEDKTHWVDAFIINIDGEDYLSYEGYQKGFIKDNNIGKVMCVVSGLVSLTSLGSLIFVVKYYNKKEKEETINAYK